MNWLFVGLTAIAGAVLSIQAGVNGALGRKVGTIEGALISFIVGTLVLFLVTIFFGKGNILSVVSVPKWQLLGGVLGAGYLFVMVLVVPKIGVGSSLIAVIAGQILMSTLIDHFNFFGGKQILIDWKRIVAILLMGFALYLYNKR
ncbi:DMT family transporter [Aneurinibacillus sp. Ricciae_BoGa-3]|uniref:DMT family transporter n=1 Tax=Aneurinibacillus sp. Ricciae_BoGa-3 TaxID=3022697 RepID=UPI002340BBD5|nr:DMT family transporter [Aneurinibacillus sp. Ricciae_BoGa-3]WCK53263.1 DMT family transporter [Aneurinibacillus sp. Ricciae_BoGa-3]